jgi:hypothetical protein
MRHRMLSRMLATVLAAIIGAVLMSGSDQRVTARPYPHWQELPAPPLSAHVERLGLRIGHRVLVLGGHDGAVYDLRTGVWSHLRTAVPVADRDQVVAAGGVAVLRHLRTGRPAAWWSYDPGHGTWSRLGHLPPRLSAPSAFGSEVYALSGRRVVVHSVALGRWTRLPADPLRPALRGGRVTASSAGTVVRGYAGPSRTAVADRWDGLAWHRTRSVASDGGAARPLSLPPGVPRRGATGIRVGSRLVVISGSRAWIHTP